MAQRTHVDVVASGKNSGPARGHGNLHGEIISGIEIIGVGGADVDGDVGRGGSGEFACAGGDGAVLGGEEVVGFHTVYGGPGAGTAGGGQAHAGGDDQVTCVVGGGVEACRGGVLHQLGVVDG